VVDNALSLEPLALPKASELLADALRQRILAEEARVSCTVVRESSRILEIEGLVSTRPRRDGGSTVRESDERSFARSADQFVRGRGLRSGTAIEGMHTTGIRQDALAARDRIVAAIAVGAVGRARRAIARHVDAYREHARALPLNQDLPLNVAGIRL
jgi:DNA-binding FadR family transcriptional regulator